MSAHKFEPLLQSRDDEPARMRPVLVFDRLRTPHRICVRLALLRLSDRNCGEQRLTVLCDDSRPTCGDSAA